MAIMLGAIALAVGTVLPNPQLQPTNAVRPEVHCASTLLEAIMDVGFHRSFAADLPVVRRNGVQVVDELKTWDLREFTVQDPDGNRFRVFYDLGPSMGLRRSVRAGV
jgi:hypothetical protein